jgi:anti-sigma B factor antagonist
MQTTIEKTGDVAVVTVNLEQLDASSADQFKREMQPVLQGCTRLVLDLGPVQFVDSRGCGVLLSCLKHVAGAGGDLKLCRVSQPVGAIFQLIRLDRICEIFNTREEAVQAFRSSRSGKAPVLASETAAIPRGCQ